MNKNFACSASSVAAGLATGLALSCLLAQPMPGGSGAGLVAVALVMAGSCALYVLWLLRKTRLANRTLTAQLAQAKAAHSDAEAFTQAVLDVIPMPIYLKDADSRYIIVNAAHAQQVDRQAAAIIGQCSFDLAPNEEVAVASRQEDLAVLQGTPLVTEKHMIDTPTGEEQFMVVTKSRCAQSQGRHVIVCSWFDATAWRVAERKLQDALSRETLLRERTQDFIQRLVDVIPDPFYVKDAHSRVLLANNALAAERNTTKQALVGRDPVSMAIDRRRADEASAEDLAVIAGAEIDKEQYIQCDETGEERYRHIIKRRCVHVDGEPVIVAASFDITRWKIAERELARLAHQDSLTGLPNRRGFLEAATKSFSRAERHDETLSLLLLDLDHFKGINDKYGHNIGDKVLEAVGEHLRKALRNEDMPCRWGGEEFAVLLPVTSADGGMLVAQRLRHAIESTPIATGAGIPFTVTISCGVAQRRHAETLDELINRADQALYGAKHAGRNACLLAA